MALGSLARTGFVSIAVVLAGCEDGVDPSDPPDDGSGGESGTDAAPDDDGGADTGDGDDDGGGTGGDPSTGDDPGPDGAYARGIAIDRVVANQGVEVPLSQGADWVGGPGRNVPLAQRRETLIQVLWRVEPGFTRREIEGVLTLELPDGTKESARKTVDIAGDALAGSLHRSLWWVLPPDLAVNGVQFQVELFETGPVDDAVPEAIPVSPADGPHPIGFEDSYQIIRMTLVPVTHELDGCSRTPSIGGHEAAVIREFIHLYNPTEEVEVTVRDPITVTGPFDSGAANGLLNTLSQLRFDDGAPPGDYYFGAFSACDNRLGYSGQAMSTPNDPLKEDAWKRVAIGKWDTAKGWGQENVVHELGHGQGRRHVACSGEGSVDPRYPYDGGDIGTLGFGIPLPDAVVPELSFSLHKPGERRDYMTYCGPEWVSDWGWGEVYPFIAEISSWDLEGTDPDPYGGTLLVGSLDPDGGAEWFTVPGRERAAPSPGHALRLQLDGTDVELPAVVERRPDSDVRHAIVELPDGPVVTAAEATWSTPRGEIRIDLAAPKVARRLNRGRGTDE